MDLLRIYYVSLGLAVMFTLSVAFDGFRDLVGNGSSKRRIQWPRVFRAVIFMPVFSFVSSIFIFVLIATVLGGLEIFVRATNAVISFRVSHGLYASQIPESVLPASIVVGALLIFVSYRFQLKDRVMTARVQTTAVAGVTLVVAPFVLQWLGDWYELLSLALGTLLLAGSWSLWKGDKALSGLFALASLPFLFVALLANYPTS